MSKALELAKECGALIGSVVDSCGDSVLLSIEDFETFYAKAQAQALRYAYNHAECLSDLMDMADELENGK